jgi:hypothetical protein
MTIFLGERYFVAPDAPTVPQAVPVIFSNQPDTCGRFIGTSPAPGEVRLTVFFGARYSLPPTP